MRRQSPRWVGAIVLLGPAKSSRTLTRLIDSNLVGMGEDCSIEVRLQPRASRDELFGMRNGVLRVKVTAPPVDGKANEALCRLIAKSVGVAPSKVSIVRGEKSRDKVVRIESLDDAAVRRALSGDRKDS